MVINLVQIELAYINTKHPDFIEAGQLQRALNSGEFSDRHSERVSSASVTPVTSNYSQSASVSNGLPNGSLKNSMAEMNLNSNNPGEQFFNYIC